MDPSGKGDDQAINMGEEETSEDISRTATGTDNGDPFWGRQQTARAGVVSVVDTQPHQEQPHVAQPDDSTDGEDAEEAPADPAGWQHYVRPAALSVVVGGLSGAVMAVAATLLISELRPPMDPRMEPLARQVGGFTQRLNEHETGLGAVEVDVVRLLDRQAEFSAAMAEQNTAIATAMTEIEVAREELRQDNGLGSPVFGVAVVQLTDALRRGRPFETEWVNLSNLAADDPDLMVRLQRLLPFVRTGVETIGMLRQHVRALAEDNGVPITVDGDLVRIAMDYLQTQLGLPIGATPAEQAATATLTEADRRLSLGEVSGAVELIADISEPYASAFGGWMKAAERRQDADATAARFTATAREQVRQRALQEISAMGGSTESIDRRITPLSLTK